MTDNHADVRRHVRIYIAVLIALAVLTAFTVAASQLEASMSLHVATALLIAALKGSLVAAVFMHLRWERNAPLWGLLVVCAMLAAALLVLPVLTSHDLPPGVRLGTWE